ncbi:MAG: glycosyltransferase [Clostridia bacterium]|nr:glycosyltransferase [Clostridia bacterium]
MAIIKEFPIHEGLRDLSPYIPIVGEQKVEELIRLAEDLRGVRLQQINSARKGGGVAEMLQSVIPLERSLGLDVSWEVVTGPQQFFLYTKTLHNFLQGKDGLPDILGAKFYWDTNAANYHLVDEDAEVVLIHDPQPAGLIEFAPPEVRARQKWLWRCHIQLSQDHHKYMTDFLRPLIEKYDTVICSSSRFLPPWAAEFTVILPYIDPLSDKNRELAEDEIQSVLDTYGIEDPKSKPLITLISRFDPFKGHTYAIDAFLKVHDKMPCQLLLAGGTASDDPENERIFAELQGKTEGMPDIHLLNLPPDSHKEINAFQRASAVILQPSLKEGFGLTVSEGMWKEKPVIGGDTGGIPAQITDGYNGFLVPPGKKGVELMAERIAYILTHPKIAQEMGKRAKETVRERYLITRGIWDELSTIKQLLRPVS